MMTINMDKKITILYHQTFERLDGEAEGKSRESRSDRAMFQFIDTKLTILYQRNSLQLEEGNFEATRCDGATEPHGWLVFSSVVIIQDVCVERMLPSG
jgi:hypothetical protein